MIARLTSQTNTSSNAKAGVMIKQSTTAGSNYLMISSGPAGRSSRSSTTSTDPPAGRTYTFPNVWMKLVSLNGKITAYLSSDGVTWTSVTVQDAGHHQPGDHRAVRVLAQRLRARHGDLRQRQLHPRAVRAARRCAS